MRQRKQESDLETLLNSVLANGEAMAFVEDYGGSRRWLEQGLALCSTAAQARRSHAEQQQALASWRRDFQSHLRRSLRRRPDVRQKLKVGEQTPKNTTVNPSVNQLRNETGNK
jgi:CII-binding regulator of phage lambda lysogenization HflD